MVDMHKRMGDEDHQDKTVTLEVIHNLMKGLEEDYFEAGTDEKRGLLWICRCLS